MTLTEITLAGILALARPPAVDVDTERERLEELAGAIAGAVQERVELSSWLPGTVAELPLQGPAAAEGTALALVAIAYHESAFRADVADCRTVGSDRPSVTAFQLVGPFALGEHTQAELCSYPKLAAQRALWVLSRHGKRCRWRGALCVFRGYASGDPGRDTAAARRQCALWERLTRRAGLWASCDSRFVQR